MSAEADDPFQPIREHEKSIEALGEREDQMGAIARYMLALARDEKPSPYDCRLSGLPDPREVGE